MKEAFFESPFYVYLTLAFAELVLVVVWHEKRTRAWALSLLIPVLLTGAVVLVERLVVTDREQIIAAARDIAAAVETRDLERIPQHLDDKFSAKLPGKRIDRDKAVAEINAKISRRNITGVNFRKTDIEVTGSEAKMHTTTILIYGEEGSRTSLIWDITWIKRAGRWKILEVAEPRHGIEL